MRNLKLRPVVEPKRVTWSGRGRWITFSVDAYATNSSNVAEGSLFRAVANRPGASRAILLKLLSMSLRRDVVDFLYGWV